MNSGINRGLRRSQGVGFRGQGKPRNEDSRDGQPSSIIRRSGDPPSFPGPQITKGGWRGSSRKDSARAHTIEPSVRIRRGKKSIKPEEDAPRYLSLSKLSSASERTARPSRDFGQSNERRNPRGYDKERPAYASRDTDASKYRPADRHTTTFEHRSQDSTPSFSFNNRDRGTDSRAERSPPTSRPSFSFNGRERVPDSRAGRSPPTSKSDDSTISNQRFSLSVDKRMPLSIPYTTPASEFLYGTSVVEAALNSQREARRKLYKLYIYTGENREKADPAGLERLARRKGIEVARVGLEWLRALDKMSGGRPHNGYVLEASPLPRLPVAHLGELAEQNGERGFRLTVEHQSREEAAVNGTTDFIKLPSKYERNPFVLFLDSIEDPGNLGGIIRTAAFLGVTAVAYSVRNSASFTPVVLKASAGASENVTLFAVNKPAGFIANSQLAGWKIYAAVAPSKSKAPNAPPALSADELQNPLSQDPCILMLGGEGEGLRANLRSKADVDLSIRGRGPRHNVDSLNVSVAAGILCDAFLRRNHARGVIAPPVEAAESDKAAKPAGDIF